MEEFRYSASVDPANANTSHAIVLALVGSGKRVLDVGCATGYLAAALTAQGNKVSGIEIDARAAELARPHLEKLVVGDLEHVDMVSEFGLSGFDIVVFADVLEHLTDPTSVLRRSRALLADGGSVVISIPNVAHGSVRLSLLRGRFDYGPVGLLDDTHLRFFTRDLFEDMLFDAGFRAVDTRETTADPFATEIALDPSDYAPELMAAVRADHESQVYQFVVRAEPFEGSPGPGALTQALEVHDLRRALAHMGRLAGGWERPPTVGILDGASDDGAPLDGAVRALRMAVAVNETRRRLPDFTVRSYTRSSHLPLCGLVGEVIEPLPSPGAADGDPGLRGEVDTILALDGEPEEGEPSAHLLAALETPDLLVLAGRLAPRALLDSRREYLVVTGQAPAARYVLCLPADSADEALDKAVAGIGTVVRPEPAPGPVDLLGLVRGAEAVVTSSAAVAAVAIGLERPVLLLPTGEVPPWAAGLEGGGLADVPRLVEAGNGVPDRAALIDEVDRCVDHIVERTERSAVPAMARTAVEKVAAMKRRLSAVEAANAGLRGSLHRERMVMADELRRRDGTSVPGAPVSSLVLARQLAAEQQTVSDLRAEIDRIYATLTMRLVAPLRRTYGRVRRLGR